MHMNTRRVYAQGKWDVENAHKNMKQENVKMKRWYAQIVKTYIVYDSMNVQIVNEKGNKKKYYRINYPTFIYHDDNNITWNITK